MALKLSELECNLLAKFSVRVSAPPVGLLTESSWPRWDEVAKSLRPCPSSAALEQSQDCFVGVEEVRKELPKEKLQSPHPHTSALFEEKWTGPGVRWQG